MIKKIINSKFFLIILIVILIFLVPNFYRNNQEKKNLENQLSNLSNRILEIEDENKRLADKLIEFEGNEDAEKFLRTMYVLKKPGEKAIVMPRELLETDD